MYLCPCLVVPSSNTLCLTRSYTVVRFFIHLAIFWSEWLFPSSNYLLHVSWKIFLLLFWWCFGRWIFVSRTWPTSQVEVLVSIGIGSHPPLVVVISRNPPWFRSFFLHCWMNGSCGTRIAFQHPIMIFCSPPNVQNQIREQECVRSSWVFVAFDHGHANSPQTRQVKSLLTPLSVVLEFEKIVFCFLLCCLRFRHRFMTVKWIKLTLDTERQIFENVFQISHFSGARMCRIIFHRKVPLIIYSVGWRFSTVRLVWKAIVWRNMRARNHEMLYGEFRQT